MIKHPSCIIWLLLLCLSSIGLHAQNEAQLRLLGIHSNGKALLRWAPTDFASWQRGTQQGYRLERYTLLSNGTSLSPTQVVASRVLLATQLRPLSEAIFEQMSDTSNAAGVAGAALFEEDVQVSVGTGDPFVRALSLSEQNDSRFGLGLVAADASFGVAQAMALGYVDNGLTANSVYEYRVSFFSANATQVTGTWLATIDTRQAQSLPPLPAPTTEVNVNSVLVAWSKQGLDMYYTSYDVERSADNGSSWQKRNEHPVLPPETETANNQYSVFFTDTLESKTITYRYRLRGHSIFGLSATGTSANAKSTPAPLAEKPAITDVARETGSKLRVKWSFSSSLNAQIKGFKVYRSPFVDGPFVALSGLTAATTREYLDATPLHTNYYQVKAVDVHDREYASLALLGQPEDNIPPVQVAGLSGQIDATGLTLLKWTHNPEADLNGYRVYLADALDGEYVQVNGETVLANAFSIQVPMNTSSEYVYFKVRAVDFRDNLGDLSTALSLKRPDVIPPAQPNLAEVEPVSLGIKAKWAPSVSSDVVSHEVQRRSILQADWTTVATHAGIITGDQMTLDTTLRDAADWEYRVVATDEAGLSSTSATVKVTLPNVKRPALSAVKAESTIVDNKPAIKLSWEYVQDPLLRAFVVYRAENGGPMREFQHLDTATFLPLGQVEQGRVYYAWRDTQTKSGETYQYQLVAKFLDGSASGRSAAVTKSL